MLPDVAGGVVADGVGVVEVVVGVVFPCLLRRNILIVQNEGRLSLSLVHFRSDVRPHALDLRQGEQRHHVGPLVGHEISRAKPDRG